MTGATFGGAVLVVEGIWAIRLPLPSRLGHVNAYVFDDDGGWAVVDCGYATDDVREIWDRLLAGAFSGRPLRRLITTHGHTDHVGSAMHLLRKNDASYETTLIEWQAARLRYLERRDDGEAYIRFALSNGCGVAMARQFVESQREVARYLEEQPPAFDRISHADSVKLGGRSWTAITASGHAEEHLSLHCADEDILLSGDQVLPVISPLIPVSSSEPNGNPLGAYLQSLEMFALLPSETLVLPGHGKPFWNIVKRCAEITEHHHRRLSGMADVIRISRTAFDVAALVFGPAKMQAQGRLALSETLAHLNFLCESGKADRVNKEGSIYYRSLI